MRLGLFAFCLGVSALLVTTASLPAQAPRAETLRRGLQDTGLAGTWIYDDLKAGFAEAERSGKPLFIVFR